MSTSGPSTASSSASASSSTSGSAPARSGITAATEWAATLKNPERVARGSAAEQPRQPRQPRAPKLPAVGTFPRPQVAFETPAHEKAYYEEIVKLEPPISMKWMRRMALGGWAASAFITFYMVFYADFGDKDHVFVPARKWYNEYIGTLSSLSKEEAEALGVQQRLDKVKAKAGILSPASPRQ